MKLIDRLDAARRRWNVLEHPFYRRWECGELAPEELTAYAGEYRHAVGALADASTTATPIAGPEHAAEERAHRTLWEHFAAAVGAEPGPARLEQTDRCVATWTAASDPLEALGILYAIEASQPEIAQTKLDGLVTHYGFERDGAATAYFTLHAERDVEHARDARELLEANARPEDADRVFAAAEAALGGFSRARAGELETEPRAGARRLVVVLDDAPKYLNTALFVRMLCEIAAIVLVTVLGIFLPLMKLMESLGTAGGR